jgi:transposase
MKYNERFTSNLSQVDFSGKHLFIGIDMHKKNWVVTVRTKDLQLKTFSMDPFAEVLETLLDREYGGGIFHLVYEAGCFGYGTYDYFQEKGLDIIVTPPNRLYRENSGVKTDKRDSRGLALFLSKGLLKKVVVPSKSVRELRQIIRIRDKQKKRKKQIQQEIRGMLLFLNHSIRSKNWSRSMLAELKGLRFCEEGLNLAFKSLLEEYEFYNDKLVQSNCLIQQISRKLGDSYPCIEKITAVRGIGDLSGFRLTMYLFDRKDRFIDSDKLVHYLGLTPREHSSGEKQRRGKTGYCGNPELRASIIQIAWQSVRWDPVLLDKFERVYASSGIKQKAIVAVARKLMVKLYTAIQRGEGYQVGLAA